MRITKNDKCFFLSFTDMHKTGKNMCRVAEQLYKFISTKYFVRTWEKLNWHMIELKFSYNGKHSDGFCCVLPKPSWLMKESYK